MLLPSGRVCHSPQLHEPSLYLSDITASLCPVGWGGRGVGVGGVIPGAAAPLFVLDEGQDVGEREGLAALPTGQQVTTLLNTPDPGKGPPLLQ